MQLKNCVVVITGAAQGLGLRIAEELAGAGARLALVDLNAERLAEAAEKLAGTGAEVRGYPANIAREDEVTALFRQVAEDLGPLQGLVNNAGITRDALLLKVKDGEVVKKMSLAEWQAVIDVNLSGVFLCGREAAEQMIRGRAGERGGGLILNISSLSRAGNFGQTNYSAAKAGVAAMTTVWALELARHGIRCAAIAPGFIATEMVAAMKPEVLEQLAARIPAGRLGRPEEIAATARFIFENDYISGRVLEIDGGSRI